MLIDYKNVSICQEFNCVLKDVNFHADDGEFIYIIGRVGSGKSSLLKTMYCELDIEEAEKAEVLGSDVTKIKRKNIPALRKEKMPHQLSGGEQQRIAIARSLLNRPKVIIADEPTGNLDVETASNIISLLKDISQKGTAVIMSTHNISLIDKYPGIVYCCKDNTLKEMTGEDLQSAFHTDSADEVEAGEME